MKRSRRKRHYKKRVGRGFKLYTKGSRIFLHSGKCRAFLQIKVLASFVLQIIVLLIRQKNEAKRQLCQGQKSNN